RRATVIPVSNGARIGLPRASARTLKLTAAGRGCHFPAGELSWRDRYGTPRRSAYRIIQFHISSCDAASEVVRTTTLPDCERRSRSRQDSCFCSSRCDNRTLLADLDISATLVV